MQNNKQLQKIQDTLDVVLKDIKSLKLVLIPKKDARKEDELIRAAKHEFSNVKRISVALVQRRLMLGYGKSAELLDKLEKLGIVSQKNAEGVHRFIDEKKRNLKAKK